MTARFVQGLYYIGSGIWPLLHMKSFEAVTGPKTDRWLVKTVGTLVAIIGAGLLTGGTRKRISKDIALIGIGSAAGLSTIEMYYTSKHRISKVYLLDIPVESALIALWLRDWVRSR